MNRRAINQTIPERCLLTDVAPYETPTLFSYWGAYNYARNITPEASQPPFLRDILVERDHTIPFKYTIKKGVDDTRQLTLIHPKHGKTVSDFYRNFDVLITKICRKSPFSIRAPTNIATNYRTTEADTDEMRDIEIYSAEREYVASYFKYNRYSHLFHFYDSEEFLVLEKQFARYVHLDITKCFDSIYTHTISWAVRGRTDAKSNRFGRKDKNLPFDANFDILIQTLNYDETHGIPIGPELSRIFAEVILQRIDLRVAERLKKKRLEQNSDYCCRRYVDDVLFFFNREGDDKLFRTILSEELLLYKLHLNEPKAKIIERPFITPQSLFKQSVSRFVTDFWERSHRIVLKDSSKEVSRLRACCSIEGVGFNTVTALFLSSLRTHFLSFDIAAHPNSLDVIYTLIDLAFYAFSMDSSAQASYKISGLALDILAVLPKLAPYEQAVIKEKLVNEIQSSALSALRRGYHVEGINMLIVLREISSTLALTTEFVEELLSLCGQCHRDDEDDSSRWNYFCITGILYALADDLRFTSQRNTVVNAAIAALKRFHPAEFAESALLLLDCVSCPHLTVSGKPGTG